MMAIMFLPRQFQVTVIENLDEKHLNRAIWLFPLYMLAINVFVLPIAFGGLLHFPGGRVDADTFVLTLPMAEKQEWLALLGFLGGGLGGARLGVVREGGGANAALAVGWDRPVVSGVARLGRGRERGGGG